jgi:mRNA interferase RelE/StbE
MGYTYTVEYEPEAIADLKRLSMDIRKRVIAKINWLAANFEQLQPQSLAAELAGFYKLRVGDYRVIYEFDRDSRVINIDKVGHRSEIYG